MSFVQFAFVILLVGVVSAQGKTFVTNIFFIERRPYSFRNLW